MGWKERIEKKLDDVVNKLEEIGDDQYKIGRIMVDILNREQKDKHSAVRFNGFKKTGENILKKRNKVKEKDLKIESVIRFDCYIEELVQRLLEEANKRGINVRYFREKFDNIGEENIVQDDMNYDQLDDLIYDIIDRFRDDGYPVIVKPNRFEILQKKTNQKKNE